MHYYYSKTNTKFPTKKIDEIEFNFKTVEGYPPHAVVGGCEEDWELVFVDDKPLTADALDISNLTELQVLKLF